MKKQSFLYGAAVLAVASVLCKIMSAALKIPLDRLFLHEEGIGVYQSAYSIYNVFLAICVTGIPVALSSLIAGSNSDEAASLSKSTFVMVSVFGVVAGIMMYVFARPLATVLSGGGKPVAEMTLKILALALPFMGFISARRGYFQGKSLMTPSAVSQLAESLSKVVLGIAICAFTVKRGISYGAAGAICGVTIGAAASAAVLEIYYRRSKPEKGVFSMQKALAVLKISIPMTLGAFGFTAVMLTDTLSVPKLLAYSGVEEISRLKMFGYMTRANTVYNLPATIITAFTASAVPAIAAAKAKGDRTLLSENSVRAVKLIFLAAMPCALGMALFPKELLNLIYSSAAHWGLLALVGIMVLIMPYIQATTAMLQTLGRIWIPILISLLAVILKCALNFVFIPRVGVEGAPLATIVAFLPALLANTVMLAGCVSLKGVFSDLVKITLCGVVSCGGAKLLYIFTGGLKMLVISVALAAVVYFAMVLALKCITKEEFLGKEKQ